MQAFCAGIMTGGRCAMKTIGRQPSAKARLVTSKQVVARSRSNTDDGDHWFCRSRISFKVHGKHLDCLAARE